MKKDTNQHLSLADGLVQPSKKSGLNKISAILDEVKLERIFLNIKTDYDPSCLFRALLLRDLYNISYEKVSEAISDSISFMSFCGFSISGNKPNASTLTRYRDRLLKQGLWEQALSELNNHLSDLGLKLDKKASYVCSDVSLIPSARRPRKAYEEQVFLGGQDGKSNDKSDDTLQAEEKIKPVYSDDLDASWKKKNKKLVYGFGAYVTTDAEGFVEYVKLRPANESEIINFESCILEPAGDSLRGCRLLYDKGVISTENQEHLKRRGIKDGLMRKKPKGKKMRHWEHVRNRIISKKRFVVERSFGSLKRTYGLSRASLLGLEKVTTEVVSKSIVYNLRRASSKITLAY